jgi:hypothetical protein
VVGDYGTLVGELNAALERVSGDVRGCLKRVTSDMLEGREAGWSRLAEPVWSRDDVHWHVVRDPDYRSYMVTSDSAQNEMRHTANQGLFRSGDE